MTERENIVEFERSGREIQIFRMSKIRGLNFTYKGGPGSGHHGHAGRPGSVGGSAPGGHGSLSGPVGNEGNDGNILVKEWLSEQTSGGDWEKPTDEVRAGLKAQVARDLAANSDMTEEEAADFVKQWAQSSNDDDMRSLGIQQDAAREFDLEMSEFTQGKINKIEENPTDYSFLRKLGWSEERIRARDSWKAEHSLFEPDKQQSALRAMYNKTQMELAQRGITEVRLYRGFQSSESVGKGKIRLETNAISSWSLSEEVAMNFASSYRGVAKGYVISVVVPAQRILSVPTTGFGCLREGEITLLGGRNDFGTVIETYEQEFVSW